MQGKIWASQNLSRPFCLRCYNGAMTLQLVKTVKDLRAIVAAWRGQGHTVGLVPTMGALHAGHLSLVTQMRAASDRVVVSIFVNPAQFGEGEDFNSYPREQQKDLEKLAAVDLVYMPTVAEMYPEGTETLAANPGLSDVLCGKFRPGHFDGVVTIVAKLFLQVQPDAAIFGEKDFQQLLVIRRMTADLALPVKVLGAPMVRESDGLAMSSRNAYLNKNERKIAAILPATLTRLIEKARAGKDLRDLEKDGEVALVQGGFDRVDYIEFREGETLSLSPEAGPKTRLFVAAHIGKTRLIDNMPLS